MFGKVVWFGPFNLIILSTAPAETWTLDTLFSWQICYRLSHSAGTSSVTSQCYNNRVFLTKLTGVVSVGEAVALLWREQETLRPRVDVNDHRDGGHQREADPEHVQDHQNDQALSQVDHRHHERLVWSAVGTDGILGSKIKLLGSDLVFFRDFERAF